MGVIHGKRTSKVGELLALLVFAGCFQFIAAGQTAIFLQNASFEGNPRYASVPLGWRNCAFNAESPPDLHPVERGNYGVTQQPYEGKTYLGLVLRDNGSKESIGQALPQPLVGGHCYSFSIYLSKSNHLASRSRITGKAADYNQPARLKIWGGISPCGRKELLAISPPVDHEDWKKYDFRFQPRDSLTWISFEASLAHDESEPYNGNILVDYASPLAPVDCSTGEVLIQMDTLHIPAYKLPGESTVAPKPRKRRFLFFRF